MLFILRVIRIVISQLLDYFDKLYQQLLDKPTINQENETVVDTIITENTPRQDGKIILGTKPQVDDELIALATKEAATPDLPVGDRKVIQAGKNDPKRSTTTSYSLVDKHTTGELTSKTGSEIVQYAIDEIIAIGTKVMETVPPETPSELTSTNTSEATSESSSVISSESTNGIPTQTGISDYPQTEMTKPTNTRKEAAPKTKLTENKPFGKHLVTVNPEDYTKLVHKINQAMTATPVAQTTATTRPSTPAPSGKVLPNTDNRENNLLALLGLSLLGLVGLGKRKKEPRLTR